MIDLDTLRSIAAKAKPSAAEVKQVHAALGDLLTAVEEREVLLGIVQALEPEPDASGAWHFNARLSSLTPAERTALAEVWSGWDPEPDASTATLPLRPGASERSDRYGESHRCGFAAQTAPQAALHRGSEP